MMPRCEFIHNLPCEQVSDRIIELEDENAKLKEHVRWLKKGDVLHVLTDQELADQLKHEREMRASITALDDENAKLRKLARGLNWCTENAKVPSAECERCPLGDTFFECGELSCERLMRELRIEVEDEDEG